MFLDQISAIMTSHVRVSHIFRFPLPTNQINGFDFDFHRKLLANERKQFISYTPILLFTQRHLFQMYVAVAHRHLSVEFREPFYYNTHDYNKNVIKIIQIIIE